MEHINSKSTLDLEAHRLQLFTALHGATLGEHGISWINQQAFCSAGHHAVGCLTDVFDVVFENNFILITVKGRCCCCCSFSSMNV